jgi:FMN phosphatase YigB (HAD superfamily)
MASWMQSINTFSFDMGYTLFNYTGITPKALEHQKKLLLRSLDKANINISDPDSFWKIYREIDEEIYLTKLAELKDSRYIYPRLRIALNRIGINHLSDNELIEIISPMVNWKFSHENLIIEPKVPELLNWLRDHNYNIMMISNFPERTGPGQHHFLKTLLKHYQLEEYFSPLIVSGEFELAKPHQKLFEVAQTKVKSDFNQIVHVGDDFKADVYGANKLGMKTIWIKHPDHLTERIDSIMPDFECNRINELYEWLINQ